MCPTVDPGAAVVALTPSFPLSAFINFLSVYEREILLK